MLDDDENDLHAGAAGSIDGVSWRFQSFGINELEMVALVPASWNQVAGWLKQIDTLQQSPERM